MAENIKKRREILGLSQEKLAELSDLSVQTINTIEGCRMWVSDKTITRLAKALKVEIFQLLVPYNVKKTADKNELNTTQAAVLLDLKQKIKKDIENLNTLLEAEFNEALKTPAQC